jgi:hypothetical protein
MVFDHLLSSILCIYPTVPELTTIHISYEEKGNIHMNFTTKLPMTEEIELTDNELKTATGGWGGGGAQEEWEQVWTPNGPVWELVPVYGGGGWDNDNFGGWWGDRDDRGGRGDRGGRSRR